MKKTLLILSVVSLISCQPPSTVDQPEWKLGVALWTFHTLSFPGQLTSADSTGIEYVEGFAFGKSGPELKDSLIFTLSPAGVNKLMQRITDSGLKMESMYLVGDKDLGVWKKEFEMARSLHLKYVTAEPPVSILDRIDSLAGAYGIKVAIHNHWKGVSQYWNPDTLAAALKGRPNLGACPDVGHWPKSGIDPVEGLKKLEGHIIALHLKDIAAANDPKLQDVRVGTGVVNFPEIFKELKRQKFNGNINIERDAEAKPSNRVSVMETIEYYNKEIAKLK